MCMTKYDLNLFNCLGAFIALRVASTCGRGNETRSHFASVRTIPQNIHSETRKRQVCIIVYMYSLCRHVRKKTNNE